MFFTIKKMHSHKFFTLLNILLVYGHIFKKWLKITFISTYVTILLLLTKTNESWKPLGTLFKTLEKTPYQTHHFNGNIIRSRTKVFRKNTYQSYYAMEALTLHL
jgi:hypothetical protein